MKTNRFLILCLMTLAMCLGNASVAMAGKKSDMKVNYVLQNLGVKRDVQAKLKPLLVSYLADKKVANKEYDTLKDKLKPSIDNGTLTDKQADRLLQLKWQAAEKELAVKRQYETKLKTVLPSKKVYLCFDLLNDKKSKMMGGGKGKDDED
ncbi:MAG: hypothetical protein J5671_04910 [Bacteroidaceae bacterium]|nr:hypothetical protein [Bacteroidaceae bacterium]